MRKARSISETTMRAESKGNDFCESVILTVQFIRFLVVISLIMNFSFSQPRQRARDESVEHLHALSFSGRRNERKEKDSLVHIDFSAAIHCSFLLWFTLSTLSADRRPLRIQTLRNGWDMNGVRIGRNIIRLSTKQTGYSKLRRISQQFAWRMASDVAEVSRCGLNMDWSDKGIVLEMVRWTREKWSKWEDKDENQRSVCLKTMYIVFGSKQNKIPI